MADIIDITQGINLLKVHFPNYNPDVKATVVAWEDFFADMDGESLKAGIMAYVSGDHEYAPSSGQIRKEVLLLHAKAAGIPDAFQAYEEAVKMPGSMERAEITDERDPDNNGVIVNVYALKFSHPIVEAVARMLGWPDRFPNPDSAMAGVDRSQFTKAYDAELARLMGDAGRLPMLTEYIESKRPELAGNAPVLAGQTMRQLAGEAAR